MNVSTVFRCVEILSNKVASLPIAFQKKKGDVFVDDAESNLSYLLQEQPNPYMSAFDLKKLMVSHLLLDGNAYIVPIWSSAVNDYIALMLVNPKSVTHNTFADTYYVNDTTAGVCGTYDESEIIHIKNFTLDGKTGLSTVAYARLTTDIALTSDKETLNRYANGGGVRGIVANDSAVTGLGEYADEELDNLSDEIEDKFRSGRQIVAIHGSTKFQQVAMSSADMQFLETKKFNVIEICRWFGVSPALVYAEGSNYKTTDMADADLLTHTLGPYLDRIENEFKRKLAPRATKKRIQFDRRLLYACDLTTKVDYQTKTIATGIYTVNDWREFENKPRVEDGDTILVSANLKSIKELSNPVQTTKADNNGQK